MNSIETPDFTCPTKSVFEKPIELFRNLNFYPFYAGPSLVIDTSKKVNAVVRTLMVLLIILSFFNRMSRTFLVYSIILFFILEVLHQLQMNPFTTKCEAARTNIYPAYPNKYGVNKHIKPSVNAQMKKCEDGNCIPLLNRDMEWSGSALVNRTSRELAPALSSPSNPFGNPLFVNYDTAVRSTQSNTFQRSYGDNIFDKMFIRPETTSLELYMNQVPNQNLISRPFIPSLVGDARTA